MEYNYIPVLTLTPSQAIIKSSKKRFKVIKAGRRFGKTKFAVHWQIERALSIPNEDHWYVAPTYRMARDIVWREYIAQLPKELILRIVEKDLAIELVNGSRICLKGSDSEDSLRGRRLGSLVMDEAAYQKSLVFDEILRPMLADLLAEVLFISTPKKGWFTSLYNDAVSGKNSEAQGFTFSIYDNPYIRKDEIEKIRQSTPEHIWFQEYLAKDTDFSGQVLNEYSLSSYFHLHTHFLGHMRFPCVVGCDWGLNDDTGVVWLHFTPEGYCILSKEHVRCNWDVHRHAEVIKLNCGGRNIDSYVLDSSAFRREGTSGRSIADCFKEEGITFARADKEFNARTEMLKRYLRGDGETPWLYIASCCTETIKAINNWEYGQHEPDIISALGYGLGYAIRRGLTSLYKNAKDLNFTFYGQSVTKNSGLNIPSPHRSLTDRWDWDYTYGTPG